MVGSVETVTKAQQSLNLRLNSSCLMWISALTFHFIGIRGDVQERVGARGLKWLDTGRRHAQGPVVKHQAKKGNIIMIAPGQDLNTSIIELLLPGIRSGWVSGRSKPKPLSRLHLLHSKSTSPHFVVSASVPVTTKYREVY